jgi:hypothetical protein
MAQRTEGKLSLDDFPTPLWATRALIEHVIGKDSVVGSSCLEPACGRGHMAVALGEYFSSVKALDIFEYGFGSVADFQKASYPENSFDWVITNPARPLLGPPFRVGAGRPTSSRLVYWDGTGLCLFTKRLEHGVFLWPSNVEPGGTLILTSAQLSMLIDGVDWRAPERQRRPAVAG